MAEFPEVPELETPTSTQPVKTALGRITPDDFDRPGADIPYTVNVEGRTLEENGIPVAEGNTLARRDDDSLGRQSPLANDGPRFAREELPYIPDLQVPEQEQATRNFFDVARDFVEDAVDDVRRLGWKAALALGIATAGAVAGAAADRDHHHKDTAADVGGDFKPVSLPELTPEEKRQAVITQNGTIPDVGLSLAQPAGLHTEDGRATLERREEELRAVGGGGLGLDEKEAHTRAYQSMVSHLSDAEFDRGITLEGRGVDHKTAMAEAKVSLDPNHLVSDVEFNRTLDLVTAGKDLEVAKQIAAGSVNAGMTDGEFQNAQAVDEISASAKAKGSEIHAMYKVGLESGMQPEDALSAAKHAHDDGVSAERFEHQKGAELAFRNADESYQHGHYANAVGNTLHGASEVAQAAYAAVTEPSIVEVHEGSKTLEERFAPEGGHVERLEAEKGRSTAKSAVR